LVLHGKLLQYYIIRIFRTLMQGCALFYASSARMLWNTSSAGYSLAFPA
jgi:hypothetical protein